MTLSGYKQRCGECGDSYSRAGSYCPYCGTPSGVEFELGIGAVLYEDRPDTPDDERRLHHVTDRLVSLDNGDTFYVIWDGTHTSRYYYRGEDVFADFTPGGWSWPTGLKPTYYLTRECGVDDKMDLMTDGGVDRSSGGMDKYACPCEGCDRYSLSPDEYCVTCIHHDCGREVRC